MKGYPVTDWLVFVQVYVPYIIFITQWLVYLMIGQFCLTSAGLLMRFIKIKFGKKIKPEGCKGILITGATSGFGLALAKHFYQRGFSVFAGYFNDKESGYKELSQLSKKWLDSGEDKRTVQVRLFLIKMDVRSCDSIAKSYEEIECLLNKYNIQLFSLINNAGLAGSGSFEWIDRESISNMLDTNLKGAMLVTRQFVLQIIKNKGKVINVSSCTYLYPGRNFSVYGTTKAAIAYFSEFLQENLKDYGASCICVHPGNFMPASNILFSAMRSGQESEKKLSPEEKVIYKESISRNNRFINKLLKKRLTSPLDEESKKFEELYNVQFSGLENVEQSSLLQRVADFFFSSLTVLDGRSKDIESSNLMNVFNDAICLVDPPKRLYAGNTLYSLVLGPSIDFMAPNMRAKLNGLVNRILEQP